MSRPQAAAVTVGACVLVALQLAGLVASRTSAEILAVDVAVALVSLASLPVLMARPVGGGLLVNTLAALSPAGTPVATLATFHVARGRPFRAAATVAGVGVVAHLVQGLWRPVEGLPFGWHAILVVAAYSTLMGWGAYAQARAALLDSLRDRVRRAEAEQARRVAEGRASERARLAREMHDVLAHRLTLLTTYAGALEYRPDSSPERIAEAAGVVRNGVHEALHEVREVITLLREPDDPEPGASLRPQPTLVDLPRLLEECRTAGMSMSVEIVDDPAAAVPLRVSRDAYRVVQEALTNARRHSPGSRVTLQVRRPAPTSLEVQVSNPVADGRPAPPAARPPGHGLVGLEERVSLAGGRLRHGVVGGDFRLQAWFGWEA
jgi:signal transduction histidine kinase